MAPTTNNADNNTGDSAFSTDSPQFMIAQYQSLRDEIIKRIEMEHQLVGLAMIAAGTVLAAGVQGNRAYIILLLPPITFFLATAWAQNDRRIREISTFIRSQIESRADQKVLWWETYKGTREGMSGSLNLVAANSLFIGIQMMAFILGASLSKTLNVLREWYLTEPVPTLDPLVTALLVIDLASILLTAVVLRRIRIRGLDKPRSAP